MPRGYTTELTDEVVAKIKELHANGVWVKQISKEVQVPYTKVCDILNPKQEKVVSFNLNQSNKSELEKLNYLYPSISKEVKFIFFKHLNRIYQKFFLNQNLT